MDEIVIFDKDYVKLYMTVDEFVENETTSGKYSYIINGTTVKEDDLRLAVNGEIVSIWGIWEDDEYHYLKYTDEHAVTVVTLWNEQYSATTFVDSASNEYYAVKESDVNQGNFYPYETYYVCSGDPSNVQQFDRAILVSGVTEPSIVYPNSSAEIVPLTGLTICLNDWTDNERFLGKTFTTDKEIVMVTRSGDTYAYSAMVFTCNETHETVYAEISSWYYEQYGDIFGNVTFYTGTNLDAVVDCGSIDRTVIVKDYPRYMKSDEPCAAYIDETDEVIFNYASLRLYHIRATYNVTTTDEPTRISWRDGGIQTATFKAILDDETVIWDDIPDSEYQNGEGYYIIVNNGMGSSYQFETTGLHTIDFYYNFDAVKINRSYGGYNDYTVPLMAFADSPALTEVEFFEGIEGFDFTEVFGSGWYGGDADTGLTTIRLPKGFLYCTDGSSWYSLGSLEKLYYGGTLNEYLQINFYRNFFYNGGSAELYCDGQLISGNLVIDGTNKSLDYASFTNYSHITSITFQEGVEHIGSGFSSCYNLASVSLPNTLQSIGSYAFSNTGLLSVTIPTGVTFIPDHAFAYCYSLSSVTFSSAVEIDHDAFYSSRLENVSVPANSVLYPRAFNYCNNLKSVVLGENVSLVESSGSSYMRGGQFSGCTSLTSMTIPNSITSIPVSALPNTYLTAYCPSYGNIYYPNDVVAYRVKNFSITSCTFKDETISITPYAFYTCGQLRSVTIPAGVKSIPDYCFEYCYKLTGVTFLGTSLESIGVQSFYQCSGLTSIAIPSGTTKIGDEAFYGCKSLSSVTVPDSVVEIGSRALYNTPFIVSGYCPSDGNIYYPNNVVAFSAISTTITACALKPTTKSIAADCFRSCTGLTTINIPNSVTLIGERAFYQCSGLINIVIPDSVTKIGDTCFYRCSGLTSVTLSNSLTGLSNYCLQGTSLLDITIPNTVETVGAYCFDGCSNLTSVTFGKSVKSCSGVSFQNCTSLSRMTFLSEKAPVVYYDAFRGVPTTGTVYYPAGSKYRDFESTLNSSEGRKWVFIPVY